jgi:hypothetical protein
MMRGISQMASWNAATPSTLLPILVMLIFVGLILRILLLLRLRTRHRDVWADLGMSSTGFWGHQGSRKLFRLVGIRGEFRNLNDQSLNALVYALWVAVIGMIVTFACVILLALAGRT